MNISFKANIIINKNLDGYLNSKDRATIDQCVEILETPKFKQATEGDTIEIRRCGKSKQEDRKSIEFVINNKELEKPLEIDFCRYKSGELGLFSLMTQMAIYIYCCKFNLTPKFYWGLDDILNATIAEIKKRYP